MRSVYGKRALNLEKTTWGDEGRGAAVYQKSNMCSDCKCSARQSGNSCASRKETESCRLGRELARTLDASRGAGIAGGIVKIRLGDDGRDGASRRCGK